MRRTRSFIQPALILAALTLSLAAGLAAARATGDGREAYQSARAAQAASSVTGADAFLAGDCRATQGAVICTR